MASKPDNRLPKDIQAALKIFPKIVKQKEKAARERQKILKNFAPFSRKLKKLIDKTREEQANTHPWRLCPIGQHWVASHPMSVPVSEKNPTGLTLRDGHCRKNRSKKDQIYSDEIHRVAADHFSRVRELPTPDSLDRANGNNYDHIIGGWTKYWNDVLQPKVTLDPNIVKALISTESDFKKASVALASKSNWARGLMQITDETLEILSDEKGELKDFLIDIDQTEVLDPNLNICAGIRWLFHKKHLLERKGRRTATWEEAVMEYKSYTQDIKKKRQSAIAQHNKFLAIYARLKK